MKTDTVFKRAFNDALDLVSTLEDGEPLPPENALSAQLGVSRTTVRKVLASLAERGVVTGEGRQRVVRLGDKAARRFPEAETVPVGGAGRKAIHGMDAARQGAAPAPASTNSNWRVNSASRPPASASSSTASGVSD